MAGGGRFSIGIGRTFAMAKAPRTASVKLIRFPANRATCGLNPTRRHGAMPVVKAAESTTARPSKVPLGGPLAVAEGPGLAPTPAPASNQRCAAIHTCQPSIWTDSSARLHFHHGELDIDGSSTRRRREAPCNLWSVVRVSEPGKFLRIDGKPLLTPSVVCFLDVLGTSESTKGGRANETLQSLDAALARARERASTDEPWYWAKSSWFSDNLALAAALGDENDLYEGILAAVIIGAIWIQYLLAIEGFFTRGGLTVGDQFLDERVNFGPALVEAAELEKQANFPRILIADAALPLIKLCCSYYAHGTDNPFMEELVVAPDGLLFLNYLAVAHEANDAAEAEVMVLHHRDAVTQALDEAPNTKARAKIEWVADYHNYFCQTFAPGNPGLQLSIEHRNGFATFDPSSFPGRRVVDGR